jgi:hypothetical protein
MDNEENIALYPKGTQVSEVWQTLLGLYSIITSCMTPHKYSEISLLSCVCIPNGKVWRRADVSLMNGLRPSAKPPFVCLILVSLSKSGTFGLLWIAFSRLSIWLIICHYVWKDSTNYITLDSAHNCGLGHELSSQCWLTCAFHVQY